MRLDWPTFQAQTAILATIDALPRKLLMVPSCPAIRRIGTWPPTDPPFAHPTWRTHINEAIRWKGMDGELAAPEQTAAHLLNMMWATRRILPLETVDSPG